MTPEERKALVDAGIDPDKATLSEPKFDSVESKFTPEEEKALKEAGIDPSKASFSEGSNGEPLPTESSAIGTAFRSFKHNALPTAAGFGGAAAGTSLGNIAGSLVGLPGVGGFAGGIGGMLAGGGLADVAQEKFFPRTPQELAQAELDTQEHPWASKIGALLPVGGFAKMGIRNLGLSAQALKALLSREVPTDIAQAALKNVATGTAAGGISSVIDPLVHGQTPTLEGVLEGLGTGALMNRPGFIHFPGHVDVPEAASQNVPIPEDLAHQQLVRERNARIMKTFSEQGLGDIAAESPQEEITPLNASPVEAAIAEERDKRLVLPSYKSDVPIDIQEPSPQGIDKNLGINKKLYVDPATGKQVLAKDTKLSDLAFVDKVIDENIKKIAPYENPPKREAQNPPVVVGEDSPKTSGEVVQDTKPGTTDELQRKGLELGIRGKSAEEVSTPLKGSLETKGVYEIKPKVDEVANPELRTSAELAKEGKGSVGQGVKYAMEKNKELGGIPTQDLSKDTSVPKSLEEKQYIKSIADIDRFKNGSETEKVLGTQSEKFYQDQDKLMGEYGNKFLVPMKGMLQGVKEHALNTSAEMRNVYEHAIQMKEKGASDIALNPREQQMYQILQNWYKATGEARNARERLHHGELDPNGVPEMMSSLAQEKFFGDSSPEGIKFTQDYVKHIAEVLEKKGATKPDSLAQAIKFTNEVKLGAKNAKGDRAAQFGALDKAEGMGLPDSMREKNLLTLMDRYTQRFARRVAYHDNIETHPILRKALGLNNVEEAKLAEGIKLPSGAEPEAIGSGELSGSVLNRIQGNFPTSFGRDIGNFVKSGMLGTATGARVFGTSNLIAISHLLPDTAVKAVVHAVGNITTSYREMMLAGKGRLNLSAYEDARGIGDPINILRKLTDINNRITGNSLLHNLSKAMVWDMGKIAAQDNLWNIRKGNRSDMRLRFMKQFAPPDWTARIAEGQFTPEDLNYIASRYVERVVGTYDPRGQASLVLDNPLLSLARWSVERSNNYVQDVVNPALNGHLGPLISSVVGMTLGGTAMTMLNEKLRGSKEKVPTFNELAAAHEDKQNIVAGAMYKMFAIGAAAGHTGMLGDLARSGMQVYFGDKPTTTVNNPLLQAAQQNVALLGDAITAWKNGDFDIGLDTLGEFLAANFQNYRMIVNNLGPDRKHEIELSNLNRDEKVYKELHGESVRGSDLNSQPNPFTGKATKDFAKEQDLAKAAQQVGPLLQRAVHRGGANPQAVLRNLHAPAGSLTTSGFPNLETQRPELARYLDWENRTQGSEKMRKNFETWLREEELNKVKRRMVPHY